MDYSFHINKIDTSNNVINIDNIDSLDSKDRCYDERIYDYIKNMADTKYILEITKFCGYSHLMVVYKEDSLLDLYIDISKQMWCDNILGLFALINTDTQSNSLNIKKIPLTANTSLRQFIANNNLKPIYSIDKPTVYRVFIDIGETQEKK